MDDILKTKGHGLIELNHSQFLEAPETYMQQLTNQWLNIVETTDATDFGRIKNMCEALSQFGQSEQHAFWKLNTRLKLPLEKLIRDSEGGGKATQWLHKLQITVLKIKPPKPSFWGGFMSMFKLLFSLKESAWQMWLETYPTHKQEILKITENLDSHKKQLKRDNSLLLSDKKALYNQMLQLENSFDMICCFEKNISHEADYQQEISTSTKQLLVDEMLPAIQQRVIELQQQLLIARQSVMTMDLFIRQNDSQIRAINQAIHTTAAAIEVTASIFMLKQTGELIEKSSNPGKQNKQVMKGTVEAQKLKQAQHLIDQALTHMEDAKVINSNQ